MNPMISVVVPVYNVARYIEQCLDSLINQDYANIEVIIVDDGSTDESGSICDQYAFSDKRVKCFHKSNGGLSDARNYGISKANGDYLAFVDSDDWVSTNMYCEMSKVIDQYDADIVCCGLERVYKNKTIVEVASESGLYGRDVALRMLLENEKIKDHACTKLFRKELFSDIDFPVGNIYEDIRTTYRLFLKANSVYLMNEPYYFYRQRGGSIARSRTSEQARRYLEAINVIRQDPKIAIEPELIEILDRRISVVSCYLYKDVIISSNGHLNDENEMIEQLRANILKKGFVTICKGSTNCRVLAIMAFFGTNISSAILRLFENIINSRYVFYK